MERAEAIARLKSFEPALRAMGATALFLFGSTARGQGRRDSDVDIFLDIEPGHPFTLFDLAAAQRLVSAGLSVPADITTRDGLLQSLNDGILREAVQIF